MKARDIRRISFMDTMCRYSRQTQLDNTLVRYMDRFSSIDGMLWKNLELAPNTPDLTNELTNKSEFKLVKLLFFNKMLTK